MTKTILRVLVAIVFALFALSARVVIGGELEIAASSTALLSGNPHDAIVHARAAALFYAPGAPHVRVAYQRLVALAKAAEEHRDIDDALFAHRAIVSASESTRWLVQPHRKEADEARAAIARIDSTLPQPSQSALEPASTIAQRELDELTRSSSPNPTWLIVLAGSFFGFLTGLLWLLFRGLDARGRLVSRTGIPAIALAALGAIGWALALTFA